MSPSDPPRLHPFLHRNEAGEVGIHWPRMTAFLAVLVAGMAIGGWAARYFTGRPFRAGQLVIPIIFVLLGQLLVLYVAKRRALEKSLWQFSLSTLFVSLTVACILFALIGADRRADLQRYTKRDRLQETIMQIVGKGNVHISDTTLIQVQRPSFDDNDLRKLLALREQLDEYRFPITILDLSGTSITDQGVAELKQLRSLECAFLLNTKITDASIDALGELPNLTVLGVNCTQVTPERLLRLSQDRPDLNIEPKTYRKLRRQ